MVQTFLTEEKNYRLLRLINFFLGIGISIVATSSLFDLLYLRMKFDLSWFGLIRSCMFFLPALSYFLASPLLKGTPYSREIVQWAYLIRIVSAVLIPVAALFTDNKLILLGAVAAGTSIAFTAAAFANNTLMVLYRQLLSQSDFNRKTAVITAILNIAPTFFSLLGTGVLSLASGLSDSDFYRLFILVAAGTGAFELLIFPLNRKLLLHTEKAKTGNKYFSKDHFRQMFAGLRSPVYRQLLFFTASSGLFSALLDTYVNVYLFKVQNVSVFTISVISNGIVFGGSYAGIWLGKLCDQIGYLKFFRIGSICIIAFTVCFGFFLEYRWAAVIFLIVVFNGSLGCLSGPMCTLRNAAASKLIPETGGESYVAVFSVVYMFSSFAGSLISSWLFALCQYRAAGAITQTFTGYFILAGIFGLILLLPLFNRSCTLLDKKVK